MVGERGAESVRERSAEYISELQDFFSSRHIRFGRPDDICAFADSLQRSEALQEETGSLVRSFLFREADRVNAGDLLEIVLSAVAGSDADGATPEVQHAIRSIFDFLHAAMRLAHALPDEAAEVEPAAGNLDDTAGFHAEPLTAGAILAAGSGTADAAPAMPAPQTNGSPQIPAASRVVDLESLHRFEQGHFEDVYSRATQRAESGRAESDHVPLPAPAQDSDTPADFFVEAAGPELAAHSRHSGSRWDDTEEEQEERSMAQGWLIPAVAAGLAVIGIGAYLVRPTTAHPAAHTAVLGGSASSSDLGTRTLIAGSSCVAPMQPGVSPESVQERSHWAQTLMDGKMYEPALTSLQEIARVDPGFPGIQLQRADALMNLKRPEEAREAVDEQITTSECLARLPAPQLDSYCNLQFSASSGQGCREQLMHIRKAAQLQAALIHLELGHRVDPDSLPVASAAEPPTSAPSPPAAPAAEAAHESAGRAAPAAAAPRTPVHRTAPLPPATEGDAAQPVLPRRPTVAKAAPERRTQGDDSLRKGEGTDSAFGAYQKPE